MTYQTKLLLVFFFSVALISKAQIKPLSSLPVYDCNLKKLGDILSKPTILIPTHNEQRLTPIIEEYCGYFGNNCIHKTEAQLTTADYNQPIFIVGDSRKIKNWKQLFLPIKQMSAGFKINGISFTDSTDGFAFIDSNRILVCGNSMSAIKDVQLAFGGGYDITVLQHGKITYFGNYNNNKWDWYNLQNLKQANYSSEKTSIFQHIYRSVTYPDTIHFAQTETALKQYEKQFLSVYKIVKPSRKIDWFIHSDMQEYGMMSGMFGTACPGNSSAGFSIRGEIHTYGYNISLVKHEFSHYLFDNAISQDNNPAFFIEGCVEYVTDLNDTAVLKSGSKLLINTRIHCVTAI